MYLSFDSSFGSNDLSVYSMQVMVSISCFHHTKSFTLMISIFKITYFQPWSKKMHHLIFTFFGIYKDIACRCCPVGTTNKTDISWFRNVSPSMESMFTCKISIKSTFTVSIDCIYCGVKPRKLTKLYSWHT